MAILINVSVLALRQVVGQACSAIGLHIGMEATEKVSQFLLQRFNDQSQRLFKALENSNNRAWQVLEIALAGETFWQRWLAPRDELAFRDQVRALLETSAPRWPGRAGPGFSPTVFAGTSRCAKCAVLTMGGLHPSVLARRSGRVAHASPSRWS